METINTVNNICWKTLSECYYLKESVPEVP